MSPPPSAASAWRYWIVSTAASTCGRSAPPHGTDTPETAGWVEHAKSVVGARRSRRWRIIAGAGAALPRHARAPKPRAVDDQPALERHSGAMRRVRRKRSARPADRRSDRTRQGRARPRRAYRQLAHPRPGRKASPRAAGLDWERMRGTVCGRSPRKSPAYSFQRSQVHIVRSLTLHPAFAHRLFGSAWATTSDVGCGAARLADQRSGRLRPKQLRKSCYWVRLERSGSANSRQLQASAARPASAIGMQCGVP